MLIGWTVLTQVAKYNIGICTRFRTYHITTYLCISSTNDRISVFMSSHKCHYFLSTYFALQYGKSRRRIQYKKMYWTTYQLFKWQYTNSVAKMISVFRGGAGVVLLLQSSSAKGGCSILQFCAFPIKHDTHVTVFIFISAVF